ncbi:MAG: hypothetical protein KC417_12985 [Myxococcales bacterium]|nr:hypothetical protein [Myxococcales bacterium]
MLRPDRETKRLLLYCLGLAASRYAVRLHALCVMSNHYHLIATDDRGVLPLFLQYFHRLVAIGVQRQRRWDEVVWEPNRQTSVVELLTSEAVIKQALYLLTNPVTAGLVQRSTDWPGVVRASTFEVERPLCFEDGRLPERVDVTFEPLPSIGSGVDVESWVTSNLEAAEREARAGRREACLGVARAMRVEPTSAPRTRRVRWQLSPRLAAVSREALREGIEALQAFRAAYRDTLRRLKRGQRTLFPNGTWLAVQRYGFEAES